MAVRSVTVLFDTGRVRSFRRRAHESVNEFHGRLLCDIENAIGPVRAGRRWAAWDDGYTDGLGAMWRHTGALYQDRKERVPGLYSLTEARAAFRPYVK
jgi:hypothetical protein